MIHYPNGVWPVMLTPYRMDGAADHEGLTALTHWYLATVAAGLFAACRPSEIFHLSLWGRAALVLTTVKLADGRATAVASGHVSPAHRTHWRKCGAWRMPGRTSLSSSATVLLARMRKHRLGDQRKAADQGGAGNATADGADVRRYLEHLR